MGEKDTRRRRKREKRDGRSRGRKAVTKWQRGKKSKRRRIKCGGRKNGK